jgi:hypothetical protein
VLYSNPVTDSSSGAVVDSATCGPVVSPEVWGRFTTTSAAKPTAPATSAIFQARGPEVLVVIVVDVLLSYLCHGHWGGSSVLTSPSLMPTRNRLARYVLLATPARRPIPSNALTSMTPRCQELTT